MKIIRFDHRGSVRHGLVTDAGVIDLTRRLPEITTLRELLGPDGRARAAQVHASAPAADHALDALTLLPPIDPRARIFCVGINYKSHAAETGRDLPPRPSTFLRTHESIVGHGARIARPRVSSHFDYEGELAAVIGAPAHGIAPEQALAHVAGYTCFNDGSVRDYQKISVTAGKNFDRSGACGPWIVTADALPDAASLTLVTRLNGTEVQRATTDLLIYPIPLIVSYLAEITTLLPGDLIATGTPAGVGSRRTPPLWMKAGDRVEVEITGIGTLSNEVIDEAGAER